jgi:hypothetical protein
MDKLYQRKGAVSNSHVGDKFEKEIHEFFKKMGHNLDRNFPLEIGITTKKNHKFDLGNELIIIECKNIRWTESDKVPSAKIRSLNEAMYYFYISPKKYEKYLVVSMDYSQKRCKSLVEYYIEKYQFLIPKDVIIIDYYEKNKNCDYYRYSEDQNMHLRIVQ